MNEAESVTLPGLLAAERRRAARRTCGALLLGALCLASLPLACAIGPLHVPEADVWRALGTLFAPGGQPPAMDPVLRSVVLDLRLQRGLLAFCVGLALAVSGCVFQGVLRNPLADAFTLGVSTGAACGASLAIFFGLGARTALTLLGLPVGVLPLAGLCGAMAALAAVLLLARAARGPGRETLVLAGIVVATVLAACIALLKALNEESTANIVFWLMGSLQGRGAGHLLLLLPYLIAGLALLGLWARDLDALSLGSAQAGLLGVDAPRARRRLLVAASLLAGAAVSVSGVIGFVGLVVPHMARRMVGAEHRPLLVFSGLLGGLTLLWADVLARSMLPGGLELPVGVVTALCGGPFFCLVLVRRGRREA
ncbi:ABC-type transporter, integral membrane subunit [Desulfovibrio sp. X2]|uniref:FecCD family ABC transporter permease n=1 Tax=Desulfovibrio sp. X2 TaxID=941449 RepID=UPI000358A09C|nr:iron ABC transporter permease [Desulfovibrio sp. X2]EPR42410.1 ABC-type transporter, integral membrane subunit [Desulfovibrio sp. X2]